MGARAEISFEVSLVGGAVDSVEDFGWGYFIPNTSPPTFEFGFRMKEVQRNSHDRSCSPQFLYSTVARYFDVRHVGIGTFSKKVPSF